jgi:hypothetical protein
MHIHWSRRMRETETDRKRHKTDCLLGQEESQKHETQMLNFVVFNTYKSHDTKQQN